MYTVLLIGMSRWQQFAGQRSHCQWLCFEQRLNTNLLPSSICCSQKPHYFGVKFETKISVGGSLPSNIRWVKKPPFGPSSQITAFYWKDFFGSFANWSAWICYKWIVRVQQVMDCSNGSLIFKFFGLRTFSFFPFFSLQKESFDTFLKKFWT